MKILILNGPNLNMTGMREPNIYGRTGYEEMMAQVERAARIAAGTMRALLSEQP